MIKSALAPDPVMRAALDVLGHACVFVRNATLAPDASVKMINLLMEAIHDIPFQLKTWNDDRLDLLRLHLRCFDSTLYPGAPNFLDRFEMLLTSYSQDTEQDGRDDGNKPSI
jgi:hypothetical protein